MAFGYKCHYGYYVDTSASTAGVVTDLTGVNINNCYLRDTNKIYYIPETLDVVSPIVNSYNANRETMRNRFRNHITDWRYYSLFPAYTISITSQDEYYQAAYALAQISLNANYNPYTFMDQFVMGNPFRWCPNLLKSMYTRLHDTKACTFVYFYTRNKLMDQHGHIYTVGSTGTITRIDTPIGISYNGSYASFSGNGTQQNAYEYLMYRFVEPLGSVHIKQTKINAQSPTYQWVVFNDDDEISSASVANSFWGFLSGDYDFKCEPGGVPDPYSGQGKSDQGGGGGTGVIPSPVPTPIPGPADLMNVNYFINIYTPSSQQLLDFANEIWAPNAGELVKGFTLQPMDAIISFHIMPWPGTLSSGNTNMQLGYYTTTAQSKYPIGEYCEVDCGTLDFPEIWGSYLDYERRFSLFLPFMGSISLQPEDVVSHSIQVKYLLNIVTGSCVAHVIQADTGVLIGSYGGNCAFQIPMTGADKSSLINGIISVATTALTGAATGGMSAPTMAGVAASSINVARSKVNYPRAGGFGANTAYMGVRVPYMTCYVPNQCVPEDQNTYTGYPSYITELISGLKGYTEIHKVHLNCPGATDAEMGEIETYLTNGVIINTTSSPTMATGGNVVLYRTSDERNVIGKSLTQIASLTGSLRQESNILTPSILIEADIGDLTKCNYFSAFDHFYWVTDITSVRDGLCIISGHVDVLETYRNGIGSSRCITKRQSENWNLYINDGSLITYSNDKMYTVNYTTGIANDTFVLVTAGR